MTKTTDSESIQSQQYRYRLSQFERAVRGVIALDNLDKESQAGILLALEHELRKEYEEEN